MEPNGSLPRTDASRTGVKTAVQAAVNVPTLSGQDVGWNDARHLRLTAHTQYTRSEAWNCPAKELQCLRPMALNSRSSRCPATRSSKLAQPSKSCRCRPAKSKGGTRRIGVVP